MNACAGSQITGRERYLKENFHCRKRSGGIHLLTGRGRKGIPSAFGKQMQMRASGVCRGVLGKSYPLRKKERTSLEEKNKLRTSREKVVVIT